LVSAVEELLHDSPRGTLSLEKAPELMSQFSVAGMNGVSRQACKNAFARVARTVKSPQLSVGGGELHLQDEDVMPGVGAGGDGDVDNSRESEGDSWEELSQKQKVKEAVAKCFGPVQGSNELEECVRCDWKRKRLVPAQKRQHLLREVGEVQGCAHASGTLPQRIAETASSASV